MCTLHMHEWYTLTVRTRLFVEHIINGSYASAWVNATQQRLFRPTSLTQLNDHYWLDRLVNVRIR
jgi:hypothetical protein